MRFPGFGHHRCRDRSEKPQIAPSGDGVEKVGVEERRGYEALALSYAQREVKLATPARARAAIPGQGLRSPSRPALALGRLPSRPQGLRRGGWRRASHGRRGQALRTRPTLLGNRCELADVPKPLFLSRLADYGVATFRQTKDELR